MLTDNKSTQQRIKAFHKLLLLDPQGKMIPYEIEIETTSFDSISFNFYKADFIADTKLEPGKFFCQDNRVVVLEQSSVRELDLQLKEIKVSKFNSPIKRFLKLKKNSVHFQLENGEVVEYKVSDRQGREFKSLIESIKSENQNMKTKSTKQSPKQILLSFKNCSKVFFRLNNETNVIVDKNNNLPQTFFSFLLVEKNVPSKMGLILAKSKEVISMDLQLIVKLDKNSQWAKNFTLSKEPAQQQICASKNIWQKIMLKSAISNQSWFSLNMFVSNLLKNDDTYFSFKGL